MSSSARYKPWKSLTDAEKADRTAARQERLKSASDRVEKAVTEILSGDQWRAALRTARRFHQYSLHNAIMIWSQRPDATRVAGFQTWKDLGRHVKKGAKGIQIWVPMRSRGPSEAGDGSVASTPVTVSSDAQGDGLQLTGKDRTYMRFGIGTVFDYADTEGKPLDEFPEMTFSSDDRPEYHAALSALLEYAQESLGCEVSMKPEHAHSDPGVRGYWNAGRNLLWVAPDGPIVEKLAVMVHETAHGLAGHRGGGTKQEKSHKEIVAEGTAFLVMDHFGFDMSASSPPYLAGYTVNAESFIASLREARELSDRIIGEIEARWESILPDVATFIAAREAASAAPQARSDEERDLGDAAVSAPITTEPVRDEGEVVSVPALVAPARGQALRPASVGALVSAACQRVRAESPSPAGIVEAAPPASVAVEVAS